MPNAKLFNTLPRIRKYANWPNGQLGIEFEQTITTAADGAAGALPRGGQVIK